MAQPLYRVEDECIVSESMDGAQVKAACEAEGLNCCVPGIHNVACSFTAGPVRICKDSCRGNVACAVGPGKLRTVGKGSCVGQSACREGSEGTSVGDYSCIGESACRWIDGTVGNGSCATGEKESCINSNWTPKKGPVDVGDCVDFCNELTDSGSCSDNAALVWDPSASQCGAEQPIPITAGGGGDPHFKTWLGQMFDFHGTCDLLMYHSQEFLHGLGLEIQVRTKARFEYSYIESVAVRIGEDVLEIGSWGEHFFNGVEDGARFPATMAGLVTVHHEQEDKKKHRFSVTVDESTKISITTFKDMVSISINAPSTEPFEGGIGLLGSATDGRMVARDGATVLESDPGAYGQEWQVRDTESKLFQKPDRFPQWPQACAMPTSDSIASARRLGENNVTREDAKKACLDSNRVQDMDACIYDVVATGDLEMARAGAF